MGKQWKQCQTLFWGAPKSLQMVTAAMKLKDTYSLEGKVMTNLDSILKNRDITLPTKVHLVKAMVFPVVMYGCESWNIKCREPAWGTPPKEKVMRKEARHTQKWDRASGDPLFPSIYPPKPESAYFTALCSHLHLWLYGGLSPTTSLGEGVNLGLQLIKFLGVTRVFQFTNSSESSLACLTGSSSRMWLFTASQLWEAWDALNFLNTDSFEKLEKLLV